MSREVRDDVLNYHNGQLTPEMADTLKLYIEEGCSPGDFTIAVLENNLREAFGRADHINRYRLFEIVSWLWNEAPADCWGSPEAVSEWFAKHEARRIAEAIQANLVKALQPKGG